ncbi:MAG: AAA family ATPase [Verrucomicrobiaceae bacterium]|nr:MAG: AAA family ATPase [Verrucomicrobiaceae bacterium]
MSRAQDSRQEIIPVIYRAACLAQEHGHEFVTLEHLLYALLDDEEVRSCGETLKVDLVALSEAMTGFFSGAFIPVTHTIPTPTKAFDEVITRTIGTALFSSKTQVKPIDVLVQLLAHQDEDSFALAAMLRAGFSALAVKKHLSHGQSSNYSAAGNMQDPLLAAAGVEGPAREITNREEAEKFLEKFCTNLNVAAQNAKVDPLIGRHDEVDQIIQIVARRTKNNVALVGEPGTGKTAIAEGLALKITQGEVPEAIAQSTVYSLNIGDLVAGTRFRGDFEERMKQVLQSLGFIDDAILFIDEIHTIMGAGSGNSGSLDVANLLKPALAKGTIRCIGATTLEEYRKHFEKDRALLRRFKKVDVEEPSVADAKLILEGLRPYYEEFHGVSFTPEAIAAAVDLTHRYVTNAFLPDKAIDIIDNAGARQRVAPVETKKTQIDVIDIEMEVSKVARIPAQTVAEDETEKLIRLEGDLRAKVYDQDEAITTLTDAVMVARAGLRDTNKPSGAYLFTGPTGVGKTEVARQLAETLGVPLLKYDMSEYMEKHAVAKLIGAPPGYVGYGEGGNGNGKLTNDVDTHPYAVLLLDEIEKAHPDVFNILLQVMDDGKLTNSGGKTVTFRNIILIMTSNAGAKDAAKNKIGFQMVENRDGDLKVINDTFSPEFRNRLDAVVRFRRLTQAGINKVVVKFLDQLRAQSADRGVTVEVSDEAITWLAQKGYDPAMGARPLTRVIHQNIKIPLSKAMILGGLKKGGTASVKVVDGALVVS